MDNFRDAEILPVDEVEFQEAYNPNKTSQIVNLVSISNPQINVETLPDHKRKKLTKEAVSTVLKLYNEVSEQYGFKVEWDIDNLQKNFDNIIDDDHEQVFKVLLSKSFSKFQLIFYQRAMINIMTLMDQVSSPEVINDMSVSVDYKYNMMNALLTLMKQVSDMYESVKVENSDIILRNIANKEQQGDMKQLQSDPFTAQVMDQLRSISLKMKEKDT